MRPALQALLDKPIDYAGLYPPASHDLPTAVNEYLRERSGPNASLVNRFVCASNKLRDLEDLLDDMGNGDRFEVTVVGNPVEDVREASASFDRDMGRVDKCRRIECSAYEVRVPGGQAAVPAIKALKRADPFGAGLETYVEFGWRDSLEDAMHEAASVSEDVGFKARTGGTTADAFPSVDEVATFIMTTTSLEAPFKFTAGLHEPLRYHDSSLDVHRHGFLNVLLASALAFCHDLSHAEVCRVLEVESADDCIAEEKLITIAGHPISSADLDEWWSYFGGFGSCSVQEPADGLKRLGYWPA